MSTAEEPKKIHLHDYPKIPLQQDVLEKLVDDAKDWAHANGLVMRTPQAKDSSDSCIFAPFALLPSPFPYHLYQQAIHVQDAIARLYHKIAYDYEFLIKCHAEVVKTDDFTRNLCDILTKVHDEGLRQTKTLVIQRSDYMCHGDQFIKEHVLKQVEVNNIAASMGAHAERVTLLHARALRELGFDAATIDAVLPPNNPIRMIGRALSMAWRDFPIKNSTIIIIVENVNQNQIDQRHVEYEMEKEGIPSTLIHRLTLTQANQQLSLDASHHLIYQSKPVGLVYFRSGYSPSDYPSSVEWNGRLIIERSDAIKAPWIGLQVANTKKVQQVLAEDGQVEKYANDAREADEIRATFAGLWALDGDKNDKVVQHALKHPERYVLKPQLEGGGGNFYGQDVADKLKTLSPDERAAHILMERFRPLVVHSYMVRAHSQVQLTDAVSELGVYGFAYGDQNALPVAQTGGSLLRTKGKLVDEGGVAVGASVIDSPFLYHLL